MKVQCINQSYFIKYVDSKMLNYKGRDITSLLDLLGWNFPPMQLVICYLTILATFLIVYPQCVLYYSWRDIWTSNKQTIIWTCTIFNFHYNSMELMCFKLLACINLYIQSSLKLIDHRHTNYNCVTGFLTKWILRNEIVKKLNLNII